MFDRIEQGLYWDKAWTLVSGCTPCSPGCTNCWALAMERRFRFRICTCGSKFHDTTIQIHPERLDIPLKRKKPTVWALWNDLFHEDVPQAFTVGVRDIMIRAENHIFLVLTKRINRALEFWGEKNPIKNIWLGVTVCTPDELWKIDELRKISAAIHWVSLEPLIANLGKVNFEHIELCVLGGETGPGARPMHPDWIRSVRDQCQAAEVKFFFKQWGITPYPANSDISDYMQAGFDPYSKSKNGGRELNGREWNELPKRKE